MALILTSGANEASIVFDGKIGWKWAVSPKLQEWLVKKEIHMTDEIVAFICRAVNSFGEDIENVIMSILGNNTVKSGRQLKNTLVKKGYRITKMGERWN